MQTAGEIASKALKLILVQAADAPLEPDEYADFLTAMNDYMAALEAEGLRLGYTPVTNVSDLVTIPSGAVRGLAANMAIEVAPDYGGMISASLVKQAEQGLRVMRLLGQRKISSRLPNTLPQGSGNRGADTFSDPYYQHPATGLLTLSGNTRATVFAAADTAVPVVGFWNVARLQVLDGDIAGRFIALDSADMTISARLTATGSGSYIFRLMKNGVSVSTAPATLTATPAVTNLSQRITVAPGDALQVFVECVGGTSNCTVTDATLEAL